jgi:predicted nucleic acid-binding Zn ribbon protein
MRHKLGSNPEWVKEEKRRKELRIQDWENNPKKFCKQCGKPIPYKKRRQSFCNQQCNGLFNGEKYKKTRNTEPVICLNCSNKTRSVRQKFCCPECSVEYKWKEKIKLAIEKGELPFHQGTAKRLLLKIKPYECEICHGTEWMGKPIPLVMDHIDGNHQNCTLENFRLVCGNCDMQLPTYKSKNKGNGRKYYREYKRKQYRPVMDNSVVGNRNPKNIIEKQFCKLCKDAKINTSNKSGMCKNCYKEIRHKNKKTRVPKPRPRKFEVDKESLKELIKNNSFCAIGRMFNVSDNAIRKRAKRLKII